MKKKTLIIVAVIIAFGLIIAFGSYSYMYKEGRDIASETAAFSIEAMKLTSEFETEAEQANQKYLNKTLEVTGIVTAAKDSVITLSGSVFCAFPKEVKQPEGKQLTVKGRCVGYDELFGEVKLDQCTLK